jgi:hypothetical protein
MSKQQELLAPTAVKQASAADYFTAHINKPIDVRVYSSFISALLGLQPRSRRVILSNPLLSPSAEYYKDKENKHLFLCHGVWEANVRVFH